MCEKTIPGDDGSPAPNHKPAFIAAVFFLFFCFNSSTYSQADTTGIYDLSLTELANLSIYSAAKIAQRVREIPSTVSVITSTEIKESGFFTLEEALATLPGFQFRNIQGINSYLFQRGIPNQNNLTLLLIDGVQINELNSGGFYAGGQYNLANVERIEVIYGPSSVAYGTNAVSGIINIITKSAMEKQLSVRALAGSFNSLLADVSYCYVDSASDFGVRLSGMYKQSEKADLKGSEGDNNWTDKMENNEKDVSLDVKAQYGDWLFGANYLQKQSPATTQIKSVGTNYRDHGTLWNIVFLNNYIKYQKELSPQTSLSSVLYNRNATVLDNSVLYVVDTAQIGYYRPNNLTGVEAILNTRFSDYLRIAGGLTLEYERLAKAPSYSYSASPSQRPPKPVSPVMVSNRLASIFFEPSFTFAERYYLSSGIRYDFSSVYERVLTPRLGFVCDYDDIILHFSYAEAFRAPKPWDFTDGLGNPALKPEKMKSFEASMTIAFGNLIKADLVAYRNKLAGAITKEYVSQNYRWINHGQVNTYGAEVQFRYRSNNIKSSVNYTFIQSMDELQSFVPEINKHGANVSFTYTFNNDVILNFHGHYTGRRENPKLIVSTNDYSIEPSFVVNGAVSYRFFNTFDFQLVVKNIFDVKYFHTSNRDPDRYRQSQRTIMLSLGYAFGYSTGIDK